MEEICNKEFEDGVARAVCSDIRDPQWLHLNGSCEPDLLMMSPPCPAWSQAFQPVGLGCDDGMLTIHAWGVSFILSPKVIVMENVKGMQQHEDWSLVKDIIDFLGFTIRWIKSIDLQEQRPQQRERLLMVAVNKTVSGLNSHICIPWSPMSPLSMEGFDVIFKLESPWDEFARIDGHTLEMYLDPDLVPK